jgi:hypothetical protein
MVVFVKDAAESISSSDGELVQLLCFGDRWGEWAKGSCGVQGAVGSVVVVERFEFAQGMQQVVWVPNWSSTSCGLGVFVYQPVEQITTSQMKLGWRRRWW